MYFMSKKINFVLFLLGFSMLGIIGFQAYWVYQSHQREERMFRREMYRSMVTAVNSESDIRVNTMYNSILGGVVDKPVNSDDYEYKISFSANKILLGSENNTVESFTISENNGQTTEQIKVFNNTDTIYTKVFDRRTDNVERQKQFERIILSLASRMFSPSELNSSAYNESSLVNSLDFELHNRKFNFDYKLAFLTEDYKFIESLKGDFKPENIDDAIVIRMLHAYPGRRLAMFVPNQDIYIMSQNSIVVFSSIVMIIILVLSIAFIIKKFFSQKKLSEIRRDFMNNMTHELKTPISTVGLALEAMENFDALTDKEKTDRYIAIARKENQRLGMLVEKVLKMSAYEKEDIQFKLEKINTNTAIEEVVKNLSFQIEKNSANVSLELNASNNNIKVDKVHFTNVIYNLIDNALKYSPESPNIVIATLNLTDQIVIDIKDNGIGIPASYHKKIFDKFFRVPSGNIHNVKGYGLGLSYVSNIIQRLDGSINVISNSPKGSIFRIKLKTAK
jgi:two-component system, OmpR family, phosphate regulon sensor histidine kinase PhoR